MTFWRARRFRDALSVPPRQPSAKRFNKASALSSVRLAKYFRNVLSHGSDTSVVGLVQVLSSSEAIDRKLYEIGDLIGVDAADPLSVAYALLAREIMSKNMLELYQSLRNAKQVIDHTHALPDEMEASEFVRQADYLRAYLGVIEIKLDTEKAHGRLEGKGPP